MKIVFDLIEFYLVLSSLQLFSHLEKYDCFGKSHFPHAYET